MSSHLGYWIYLIAAFGLLWLVRDALEGWQHAAYAAAVLAIYIAGMITGVKMARDARRW